MSSSASAAAGGGGGGDGSLDTFAERASHSWLDTLDVDPTAEKHQPNKKSRSVKSGHYVPVLPTKLPGPFLIAHSADLAQELDLSEEACASDERFVRFFSGDMTALPQFRSWCTPYALSIYGQEMYSNDPFKDGSGYGDGRAISIAEVLLPNGSRWEMQAKGGGTTPFCRGADGRAVLRSSIREFLASEAMHALGVSTTRALSLVASATETADRPWYSNRGDVDVPDENDPRLLQFPKHLRKQVIAQLMERASGPDVMVANQVAITTRVAPSFLRVGHIELFGRRARGTQREDSAAKALGKSQLEKIVRHAAFREFPDVKHDAANIEEVALGVLRRSSAELAKLTADWIRVGYVQSNFNSDNCLVAGRTMDYGPFGFMEKFKPLWNMWQGSGEHFGFLNQPAAGHKNFESLVTAMGPLLTANNKGVAAKLARDHDTAADRAVEDVWRQKLGLKQWNEAVHTLSSDLLTMMHRSQADWTITWRELASVVEQNLPLVQAADAETSAQAAKALSTDSLLLPLADAFYGELTDDAREQWAAWFRLYLQLLAAEGDAADAIAASMRLVNPVYIPREWMLVDAYTKAFEGDYSGVHELQELFRHPYVEQSEELKAKFYKKAPAEVYSAKGVGGTSYMT